MRVLSSLSNHYLGHSLDTSELFASRGLEIAENTNDIKDPIILKTLEAQFYASVGTANVYQGKYDKALYNLLEALRISEEVDRDNYIISLNVNIGALYDRQKRYDDALKYYNDALRKIDESESDSISIHTYKANIYNNISNVLLAKKDTTEMIAHYETGLVHAIKSGQKNIESIILNNLGKTYVDLKEFGKGEDYIRRALVMKREQDDKMGESQCYRNLGYLFYFNNRFDSAEYYYKKGLEAANSANALNEVMAMHEGLAMVYQGKGDYENAFKNLKIQKTLSDSLFNVTKAVEIERLQNSYEFEKAKVQLELENSKKQFRLYLGIGLMATITLLIGSITLIQRGKIKNSKLENEQLSLKQKSLELEKENLNLEVEHKTRELTTSALYLYKKNEFITEIVNELNDVKGLIKPDNLPWFNRLIRNLLKSTEDTSWTEFETRFNEVHKSFYAILQEKFPELTPNERKLCAFLKLNMSSKEISAITNQTIRSIDVARTRLRKKLELTNSDVNLVDFLEGLEINTGQQS